MNSLVKQTSILRGRSLRIFGFLLPLILLAQTSYARSADSDVVAVIKKAREYIGEESTLKSVKSLRFKGTITNASGDSGAIEIHLEAPYKQLQILTGAEVVQEFGLNDYEAWKKVYRMDDPDQYNLVPSNPEQLKRVRANTYENLNFFSSETSYQRKLEYLGRETVDGELVDKVKVTYGSIYYIRNFKVSNGQLLLTQIETGELIRESGELKVDGIRFPKTLVSLIDGEEVHRIEFDLIEVNPELSESLFTQPALPGLRKK